MANLLDEASILLTPTAYNNGSMLAVKPTNGDGDFTFSRNSAATRVNAQGLVEDVASNLPRIDYTDGCGSWLLEPQSTNLIPQSELFSDSFYIKDSGVSVGTTNNSSPSINANATKIDVTNNGRIYYNIATNTYYTSVFIKSGTFSHFSFAGSNIDLIAETNSNGTIQSFGNGWYRIGKSYTGTRPFQVQAYPDGTYSSHTTSGNYFIWGAQIEQQSYPTSYIPTSGASSTRLADIANNSGNASLINSEQGTLYTEIATLANDGYKSISISSGSNNDRVSISYNANGRLDANVKSGGVYQATFYYTGVVNPNIQNKIALKYKLNDFSLWVNGVEVATDSSGITPIGLNVLNFSPASASSENFYGKNKALAVYKTALTDEQLTALTTI